MGAILFLIIGLSIQMSKTVTIFYWFGFGFYCIAHLIRICAIYGEGGKK